MKLSAEQVKAFDEQGYVFFPDCFSEEEIALKPTTSSGSIVRKSGERKAARHAPPLPRTNSIRCSR